MALRGISLLSLLSAALLTQKRPHKRHALHHHGNAGLTIHDTQLPQKKLKREEGEEGVSCRTLGIETQGQKPNASRTRVTAF